MAIALLWLIARVGLDANQVAEEARWHVPAHTQEVAVSQDTSFPVTANAAHDRQNLPDEAWQTIALIQRGGPYPHRQDGTVFGNRERRLPSKPRGYYREYTVATPGLGHRGQRRIVTGGQPPDVWYYSDDHYQSFRKFTP
ncbi:ribonuclease [Lysobacteraceae bacterium NML07-0707]|nr:ribonuclease [Xanthomonadaceae bacterium NML07-0707]